MCRFLRDEDFFDLVCETEALNLFLIRNAQVWSASIRFGILIAGLILVIYQVQALVCDHHKNDLVAGFWDVLFAIGSLFLYMDWHGISKHNSLAQKAVSIHLKLLFLLQFYLMADGILLVSVHPLPNLITAFICKGVKLRSWLLSLACTTTVIFIFSKQRTISHYHLLYVDAADLDLIGAFEHALKEWSSNFFACVAHHDTCEVLNDVELVCLAVGKVLRKELA